MRLDDRERLPRAGRHPRTRDALLADLIRSTPEPSRTLAEQLSGLAVRYPAPEGAHPLVGTRAPGLPLHGGGRVLTALRAGRSVTLDLTGELAPGVDVHRVEVRPDGHVARAA
ncbi:hypothetical protein [Pseudonocardia dioxanivorans]|uniref:hypothetical protein n=1 Tax=Pseudonocardia dioxanivorans TaxID=240495 RepID=UPI000CCFDC73|nr:hypothetical protein [Pseudonocardia dioxanivorans]